MQVDLKGQVALVTGAATGIGKASALRLQENGATVVFSDRDLDRVRETAGNLGDAVALDVADRAAITWSQARTSSGTASPSRSLQTAPFTRPTSASRALAEASCLQVPPASRRNRAEGRATG